ncbi:hypothetical protein ABZS81_30260 [Streptomyces sp. NPDC005318]|uniref:hypothetical protein n=1 Tax=Streptomyces sp. NPDC005318 TaxID=3157031 RepID=UPI0033AE2222
MVNKPVLESAAGELARAMASPPFLYELGPEGANAATAAMQQAITSLRSALHTD